MVCSGNTLVFTVKPVGTEKAIYSCDTLPSTVTTLRLCTLGFKLKSHVRSEEFPFAPYCRSW